MRPRRPLAETWVITSHRHTDLFPGETGKVVVIPVGDEFSTAAVNDLGDICMATPAISDGTLFFRTRGKLIAIGGR